MKTATKAKSEVLSKPETAKKSDIRVLKTGVCQSLSGRSLLTYEIGIDEAKDLQLRVVGNSKAGAFCQDWINLHAVRAALDRAPKGETVTSDLLVPLYRSRSANMPGFVWSLLLHEGLVVRSIHERRRYERVETQVFDATLKALTEGKGAVAVDAKTGKAKGKKVVPEKKPSASTKSKTRPC
jgi:hypothetical protein